MCNALSSVAINCFAYTLCLLLFSFSMYHVVFYPLTNLVWNL